MDVLPDEILYSVLRLLELEDVARVAQISHSWSSLAANPRCLFEKRKFTMVK